MAKVGELESIVDNLVGRGLVSPKFVGRSIGQALIEDLKSLPKQLAESQATRANEQSNRLSEFNKLLIKNTPVRSSGSSGGVRPSASISSIKDITQPFVTSRVGGSGFFGNSLNIATPTSEGLKLSNIKSGTPEAEAVLKNLLKPAPEVNQVTFGGTAKTLMDLRNQLIGSTINPEQVTGFFS